MQSATPQGLFGTLFRHVGWDTFCREYWGQKPLHIRDCHEVTGVLPGLSEFPALLAGRLNADRWEQDTFEMHSSFVDERSAIKSMRMPAGQWAQAFNAGFSLCFGAMDRHPKLRELMDECQRVSRRSEQGFVTAYLTPKRSGGPMHFDNQHVFFLQVSGEKHWRISKTPAAAGGPMRNVMASEFPPGKKRMKVLGVETQHPDSCEMQDIVLQEGEALYMPPGTWHGPRTLDSASLHYTLGLLPVSFSTMMALQLHRFMADHPMWRTDLRYLDEDRDPAQFVAMRLDEMRALLEKLTAAELLDTRPLHLPEHEPGT